MVVQVRTPCGATWVPNRTRMTPFVTRGPSPVWLFGTFFVFFRCAVRVGLSHSGRRFPFILLCWRAGGRASGGLTGGEQTHLK